MNISIKEVLNKDHIIDIRSEFQYLKGHIRGASCIPESILLSNPSKYLTKEEVYYLYCNHGNRSKMCVNYLNQLGFHTVNIVGGYDNYLLI